MDTSTKTDVIELVRLRLNKPVSFNPVIESYVDEVGQSIANIIHVPVDSFPDEIKYVWMKAVLGYMKNDFKSDEEIDALSPASVTSIKEGDTQINFGGSTSAMSADFLGSALNSISSELVQFRVFNWK